MDLYASFTAALKAEKNAGYGFVVLGGLLLLVSTYLFTGAGKQVFFSTAKYPGLALGLFMVVGGFFYVRQLDQHIQTQTALYQKSQPEFVQAETARSTKLAAGYDKYTWVYAGLAVVALGVIFFFPRTLWGGIGYVLLVYSVYTVGSERYSAAHTKQYLQELRAWAGGSK